MAEATPSDTVRIKVTRDLGLRDVVLLGLGAMVGAGVFVLTGTVASVAGVAAVLGIGMAAFVVFLNSLAYAELAGARPDAAGGGYGWVRDTLPAPSGFLTGWLSWAGHLAAAALSAAGIGLLADYLLDEVFNVSEKIIAAIVFLAFVAAGTRRFAPPARRFAWIGILKIALVALFVGVAAVALLWVPNLSLKFGSPLSPAPIPGITLAAGMFFVAFQGFETIAQSADRAKSPHRTVPAGIFAALGISFILYLAFYLVLLGNVTTNGGTCSTAWACLAAGPRDLREPELGSLFAAGSIAGPTGWPVVLFLGAAVLAMTTALASNLASATRVSFTMARDDNLPAVLGNMREKTHTPVPAQLAGGAFGLVFLLPLSIEGLAAAAGILFLILYAFVNIALIAERRHQRAAARGFRVLLVPIVPALTAAVDIALAIDLYAFPRFSDEVFSPGQLAWYVVSVWIAVGLIYRYFSSSTRTPPTRVVSKPRVELYDVLSAKEDRFDPARFRVFLPLREFDDPDLVEFGAVMAKARDGELSLLNVVEVPASLPPKAIKFRYVDDRIHGLQKLARIGERMGVDTRAVVKIGNRVYEIILDTLREEDVNVLVMGWRGERIEGDRRVLGSNIDYLIENAPCDVVVFKTHGFRRPLRRIVVLTSPIWGLEGIDDLALILAAEDHPVVEVVALASDPSEAERLKQESTRFEGRAHERGVIVEPKVIYSTQWESEALRESAEASLLMIRATSPGGLRKFSLGPVEDRIVKLAKCPVLILRKGT